MQKVEDATDGCLDTFEKADAKIAAGVQVHHAGSRGGAR
jgi:hypothetical protein